MDLCDDKIENLETTKSLNLREALTFLAYKSDKNQTIKEINKQK